jgi:hypothetical protein
MTTHPADSAVLDEAYERLHRCGPEFGGDEEGNHGLTNHGPMATEVMVRRGLDVDVHRWLDRYVPRLRELPGPTERIADDAWGNALGQGSRIGDWTDYFVREVADQPWQQVLVTWWPRLLPGIAAGATHGVIRVGHAVRTLSAGDQSPAAQAELAYGLAFWAARARPLPGFTAPSGGLAADAALRGLPRLEDQTGLIAHRLDRLADLRGWPAGLAAMRAPESPDDVPARLAELVDAAAVQYLAHGQAAPVLLVHTATAPNAVLHTLPLLPRDLWLASYGAAWAASAAVIATYAPVAPRTSAARAGVAAPAGDDPAAGLLDRAAHHADEHVIKFADTAVEAWERTGNPDALAAAVHCSELIASPLR